MNQLHLALYIRKQVHFVFMAITIAFSAAFMNASYAAAATEEARDSGKILVVVSSESAMALQGGKYYPTGYYLNELTIPVMALTRAGYQIIFANPLGNTPTMDVNSDKVSFFDGDEKRYREVRDFHDQLDTLKRPQRLADVVNAGLDDYRAVFFPGGHAPMQDLLVDDDVKRVLAHFHQHKKPTALICHGPIALLAAIPNAREFNNAMRAGDVAAATALAKNWPYRGYNMTIFSTTEEKIAESSQLGGKMFFYPQQALKTAGANVKVAFPWRSHVVVDRELITAQNPASDDALANALLNSLRLAKKDKR